MIFCEVDMEQFIADEIQRVRQIWKACKSEQLWFYYAGQLEELYLMQRRLNGERNEEASSVQCAMQEVR